MADGTDLTAVKQVGRVIERTFDAMGRSDQQGWTTIRSELAQSVDACLSSGLERWL